jgi:uncharacterized protein (DUF58 family)
MPSPARNSRHRRIQRKPRVDFSLTVLLYLGMIAFMGLAAMNSQANLLFAVFGLLIGILLVSWILSRWMLSRLSLSRQLPEHGQVGVPLRYSYELRNGKRFWPTLSVTVSELDGQEFFTRPPGAYLLHAAAGTCAIAPAEGLPRCRGLCELGRFQLSTSFPFGFIKRAVDGALRDVVIIHPAIAQIDARLLRLLRSTERMGARLRPRRGGSDDFYGLREYRQGESPRLIHWKRSARTGTLVTREMTHVAPPRLMVVVDSLQDSGEDAAAHVEKSIAMAGSLAHQALDTDLPVGVCAWMGEEFQLLPPARGKRHYREIMNLLARIPPNRSKTVEKLLEFASDAVEPETNLIVFTPRAGADTEPSSVGRSSPLWLSSRSERSEAWFRFAPGVDFGDCAAALHEIEQRAAARSRRNGWRRER